MEYRKKMKRRLSHYIKNQVSSLYEDDLVLDGEEYDIPAEDECVDLPAKQYPYHYEDGDIIIDSPNEISREEIDRLKRIFSSNDLGD